MTYTVIDFNDEIIQHFPPKFKWDEAQKKSWVAAMIRELSGFSPEVLQTAARQIIATRKDEKTPLVSQCIRACLEAKKWLEAEKNAGKLQIDGMASEANLDWAADRQKLATELIICPLGKQAAQEGWIKSLWNFARKKGRLPQPNEIDGCKREHKEFIEAYKKAVISPSPLVRQWVPMGDEMIKRQKEMADYVLRTVR